MQYLLIALTYRIHVYAPTQICVEQKQIAWLERRFWQLTVDVLRLMFKKLYTCLQFGDEKAAFIFLDWWKLANSTYKQNHEQNCTNLHIEKCNKLLCSKNTILKSENWRFSQLGEFLSEPVVEIIGINWAKVICILHLFS